MRYKLLGHSGLRVSEIALGTMTFGENWGWGASKEESYRIFEAFSEAGGNFIDTSVNYTDGTSEKFVGEFIQAERDQYVVATKYSLRANTVNPNDPNAGGNQRKNMRRAVETSLRNLKTDYLDLYYLHMWDYMTPVEEVMRGLNDLVSSGKVLYIGISDSPAWVVSKANILAELRGWSRFVALQVPYNLVDRAVERDLLPMARAEDMAVLAWGILEGGVLTGKYRNPQAATRYEKVSERALKYGDAICDLAEKIERSPAQIALNWIRQRPWGGAPIIPILGARSLDQFQDQLGALEFELTPEQITSLEQIAPFEIDFPESFLKSDNVRRLIFGKTYERIDNHRAMDERK